MSLVIPRVVLKVNFSRLILSLSEFVTIVPSDSDVVIVVALLISFIGLLHFFGKCSKL